MTLDNLFGHTLFYEKLVEIFEKFLKDWAINKKYIEER